MSLSRYYYHVTPPSSASTLTYEQNIEALSPYVFWPLQEASGDPVEQMGSGPTLVQYGGITYRVAGPTINGETTYGLTTSTDLLYGGGTGYLNGSTSGFTVSGWVKAATSGVVHRVFEAWSTGQGTWGVSKTTGDACQGKTFQSTDAAHGDASTSAASWPNDTWTWYALRYDTTTLRIYLGSSTADDTSFSGTWKRDGTPATVVGTAGVASSHAFLAFWTTPLTDDQMTKLRTGVF